MNIEFHYYALRYLCASAGFGPDEAGTIAMSSQIVDDCRSAWRVGSGAGAIATEVTQDYLFWDESVRTSIYLPFHFLPGDPATASAARKDGKAGPRTVTPDSPIAREVLLAALRTKDPYRIGIALHGYADTWAHQNFSADLEDSNALEHGSILPAAGHLHALRKPDDPALRWVDPRLVPGESLVDNAGRFLAAARMIYRFLCTYRRKGFADEPFVLDGLERIWRSSLPRRDGMAHAADYIVDLGVPPCERGSWQREAGARGDAGDEAGSPGYDMAAWIGTAVDTVRGKDRPVRGTLDETTYRNSRFHRWNEAVGAHRSACRAIFGSRGT